MPYQLGYSIYSSQNPSISVIPSLAAKEKGLPSDLGAMDVHRITDLK